MIDQNISPDRRTITVDLRSGSIRATLDELADRLDHEAPRWAAIGASAVSQARTAVFDLPAEYGMTAQLAIHLIRR
jgi:hypothetical protein